MIYLLSIFDALLFIHRITVYPLYLKTILNLLVLKEAYVKIIRICIKERDT